MALKTDAPPEVIWDIMRCWVKKNPITKKHNDSEVVSKILKIEPRYLYEITKFFILFIFFFFI